MLATVPYLLGFHPRESLVAVVFDEERVLVTLRMDADDLRLHPDGVDEFLRGQLKRLGATAVLLVAYTDTDAPDLADALAGLSLGLETAVLVDATAPEVLDAIHVAAGRYRSVTCVDLSCCPPDGFDYAEVLSDPAAAEAVVHGLPARADREELRAVVVHDDTRTDDGFERSLVRTLTWVGGLDGPQAAEAMDRLLARLEATEADPGPVDLGRLVGLAARPEARDVATLRIERGTAVLWLHVWSAAARCSSGPAAAAPLGLVGVAAWAQGDGALVCICLEEMEKVLPEHGLVSLLRNVVENGLHPDVWHRMREECLARFGPLGPASASEQREGEGGAVG
ncbi:DUF4192 domain-containing protein [Raineyella sp.]|uniref:DUF4192 domain-containing protein n=1 Tax=Raineyella sp. TaxID=1911550 RepID=UPI002B204C85|nr:DUF4192 domain-containing protein [Raineyella sp.]MEA5155098.1 DUF4192 domain-containing protein [Raineyella sp.]